MCDAAAGGLIEACPSGRAELLPCGSRERVRDVFWALEPRLFRAVE